MESGCIARRRRPSDVIALIAERWSRVSGTRRTGVWPAGAYVRAAAGSR
jgi:hypothetical protein